MQFNPFAVGQVIRQQRKQRHMSQELLSGLAGIARTHLTMIENGSKQPNLETLWRIAAALDLKPSILVEKIEGYIEANPANEREL
ncbi:MAG: helix-turn-helix transcriptional regulator [Oscillospiraceae bacterium]|jgi:transcriptional regulator with XRE-family HTH domain|nr:helix-turn-helix transcriptional regulator [Oscillospiraceae bacterium]MBR4193602.1 helix-turn-helix transcriptional regulator [Oscillospiraceae bacterium]